MTASFEHFVGLTSKRLLYSLYSMADSLRGQLKQGLEKSLLYIGRTSQVSTFKITLDGVTDSPMSEEQLEYFTTFTQDFASQKITQSIYEIDIQSQEVVDSSSFSKSLVVTGEFRGANEAGNTVADVFAQNIAAAIRDHSNEFMEGLAYNVVRPTSTLDLMEAAYFRGIIAVAVETSAVFQSMAPTPTPAPVSTDGSSTTQDENDKPIADLTDKASEANTSTLVIVAIIGVICIVMGIIVAMIFCRCRRRRDEGKKPSKVYDNLEEDIEDYQLPSRTNTLPGTDKSFMASSSSFDLGSEYGEDRKKEKISSGSSQRQLNRAPSSRSQGLDLHRAPSMNSLGSRNIPPPPTLQRQTSSRVSTDPKMPTLGRSQSGDGLHSASFVPKNPQLQRAQSSVAMLNSPKPSKALESNRPPPERLKSGDSLDLFSPKPQRPAVQQANSSRSEQESPKRNPNSEPRLPPLGRSKSGDGLPSYASPRKPQRAKSSMDGSNDIPSQRGTGTASPMQPPQRSRNPPKRAQSMGIPGGHSQRQSTMREPPTNRENSPQPMRNPPQRGPNSDRSMGAPPVRAPPQRSPSLPRSGSSGSDTEQRRPQAPSTPRKQREEVPVSPRRTQSMPNDKDPVSAAKRQSLNQTMPTRPSAPKRTASMPVARGGANGNLSKNPNQARPSTPQNSKPKTRNPLSPIT